MAFVVEVELRYGALMQADPGLEGFYRPCLVGQGLLEGERGAYAVGRQAEGREEAVAEVLAELRARRGGQHGAEGPVVPRQVLRVDGLAQARLERHGAFEVREHQDRRACARRSGAVLTVHAVTLLAGPRPGPRSSAEADGVRPGVEETRSSA